MLSLFEYVYNVYSMQLSPPQGVGIIPHEWHLNAVMLMAARLEVSVRAILLLKSGESQILLP